MYQISKSFKQYSADILASEKNRVSVNLGAPTPVALVYPNSYTVGISSLGYQTVYRLFNEQPQFSCERAFYEGPLVFYTETLESGRQLRSFPIIAFSLSYELDYPNVVRLLKAANVPLSAAQRHESDPFVIFGGVTTFYNPTPMACIADAVLIGEGEALIPNFARAFYDCRRMNLSRIQTLERLSSISGLYVPPVHGLQSPPFTIERQHVKNLDDIPTYSGIVSNLGHLNMFMVEVGRGCGRGCRFCVAGHVYHPYRTRSVDAILKIVETKCFATNRVGLVGAALSDFPHLGELITKLMERQFSVATSSLRIQSINRRLVRALERSDVRSITLAPEAGTERLRKLINKNLNDDAICAAARAIAQSQIETVKLYFLIGLPFERDEDLIGLVDLVERIQRILSRAGSKKLRISVNTFIPKPGTPYQWAPMASESEIKRKRRWLTKRLRTIPRTVVVPKSTREELWQGLLSLGDDQVGRTLVRWETLGQSWKHEWRKGDLALNWIHREKQYEEKFPWSFIAGGLTKEKLWQRWLTTKKWAEGD